MRKLIAAVGAVFVATLSFYFWHNDKSSSALEQDISIESRNVSNGGNFFPSSGGMAKGSSEGVLIQNRGLQDGDYWSGHTNEQIERAKQRELVFSRSRMPNEKGTRTMLKEALDSGLISQKEYYGELAHMLSDELDQPLPVIREIVESGNSYGIEVMFMTLKDAPWHLNLNEKEKEEIFSWLLKNKPAFTTDMSTISMSDVYRYENWLSSSEGFYSKDNYIDYLDNFVLHKAEEPREFFALIYSGDYQRLVGAGKIKSVAYINKVVNDYAASYPDNSVAKMILNKLSNSSG